jgi:hypothetical protein
VDAQVSYALRVTEEIIQAGHLADPGATIPGLRNIDGQTTFEDPTQEFRLLGKKLTLYLEDGRRLSVWIRGSGLIQGTGDFLKP